MVALFLQSGVIIPLQRKRAQWDDPSKTVPVRLQLNKNPVENIRIFECEEGSLNLVLLHY